MVVLLCKGAVPRAPRRFAWESASWSWSQWTNTGLAASLMTGAQFAPAPCAGSFPDPPPRSVYRQFLPKTSLNSCKDVCSTALSDRIHDWLTLYGGGKVDVGDGNAADAAHIRTSPLFLLLLNEPPSLIEIGTNLSRRNLECFAVGLTFESPHMLVPPCVEGMLSNAIPCNVGPSDRLRGTPSHWGNLLISTHIRAIIPRFLAPQY